MLSFLFLDGAILRHVSWQPTYGLTHMGLMRNPVALPHIGSQAFGAYMYPQVVMKCLLQ